MTYSLGYSSAPILSFLIIPVIALLVVISLAKDSLKDKDFIQLNNQYKNELLNINLSELSFMEILTFY